MGLGLGEAVVPGGELLAVDEADRDDGRWRGHRPSRAGRDELEQRADGLLLGQLGGHRVHDLEAVELGLHGLAVAGDVVVVVDVRLGPTDVVLAPFVATGATTGLGDVAVRAEQGRDTGPEPCRHLAREPRRKRGPAVHDDTLLVGRHHGVALGGARPVAQRHGQLDGLVRRTRRQEHGVQLFEDLERHLAGPTTDLDLAAHVRCDVGEVRELVGRDPRSVVLGVERLLADAGPAFELGDRVGPQGAMDVDHDAADDAARDAQRGRHLFVRLPGVTGRVGLRGRHAAHPADDRRTTRSDEDSESTRRDVRHTVGRYRPGMPDVTRPVPLDGI